MNADEGMIAWSQARYGGPEVVARRTAPVPEPGRGEVLLRVRATALNSGDVRVMRGDPRLVRLAFGVRRPRVAVRGMDVAGAVVHAGDGVDGLAVGDEVVGELPGGGLAEYAIARAERLVLRPSGVAADVAATLPIAAGTALQALEKAGAGADARVLVIGASGGVGTFAVQLAADRCGRVDALCGARSAAVVRGLGAADVHDYRMMPPSLLEQGAYDAVLVIAGRAPLRDLQGLLRPGGAVVLVSGDGGSVLGPIPRLAAAVLRSRGARRIVPLAATPSRERLSLLLDLVADGRIRPVIERTFGLAEADAALRHVDSGRTIGKVVVAP